MSLAIDLVPHTEPRQTSSGRVYPRGIDELARGARHVVERHASNTIEADHGRLKARPRPMRGLKWTRSAPTIAAGYTFVRNLRRGHYAFTADLPVRDRIRAACTELALDL